MADETDSHGKPAQADAEPPPSGDGRACPSKADARSVLRRACTVLSSGAASPSSIGKLSNLSPRGSELSTRRPVLISSRTGLYLTRKKSTGCTIWASALAYPMTGQPMRQGAEPTPCLSRSSAVGSAMPIRRIIRGV